MVFHTAPPQPASKARMIISPVLVGGAEASQKGLGEPMAPANLRTRMSGMGGSLRGLENGQRGPLAAGHGIYYFAAAVHAIAGGKVARIGGAAGSGIGFNVTVAHAHAAQLL